MNFIIIQFLTIGGNSPRARLRVLRLSVKRDDIRTDVITAFFFRSAICLELQYICSGDRSGIGIRPDPRAVLNTLVWLRHAIL